MIIDNRVNAGARLNYCLTSFMIRTRKGGIGSVADLEILCHRQSKNLLWFCEAVIRNALIGIEFE